MADNETVLQAKIAHLAGRINRRKQELEQQQQQTAAHPTQYQQSYNPAPAYRGNYQSGGGRYAPYSAPRGRGRGGYGPSFQNRTLVNPTTNATPPTPTHNTPQPPQYYPSQPVHYTTAQHVTTPPANREMVIEGVRFQLREDGGKLTRLTEMSGTAPPTPSKAIVAGVEFRRTKNNNLLRCLAANTATKPATEPKAPCDNFTKNGSCPFGRNCRFDHKPTKVAMCKTFFRNGSCAEGDNCDLSHKPTYNRVPACTHFLNGNCTNDACRYAHVSPSPGTLICRPFAMLGYCDKGVGCDKRHIFECPDFAETGDCTNKKCKLQHILHAHVERQKERADEDSEVEENNNEVDDIESDDLDEKVAVSGGFNEIAQNKDFVSFS